jgi:hypothetical protein
LRDIVVHMTEVKPGTTLASTRIATFLCDTIKSVGAAVDLVHTPESAKLALKQGDIDNMFVVNGPTAFCPFREEIRKLTLVADEVIWVQNDYSCYPPSQMKRALRKRWPELQARSRWQRPPVVWTTLPDRCLEPRDRYLNWNQLTYKKLECAANKKRTGGLFYYGAGRGGRMKYFETYFCTKLYPVCVSVSKRGAGAFTKLSPGIEIVPPFLSMEELSRWQAVVYMEDEYSHRHFTSLANRFYECLSAGVAQFIDQNTLGTFKQARIDVDPKWIVRNAADVAALLPKARAIAAAQQKAWTRPYHNELARDVRAAYKKLIIKGE